MRPTDWSVVEPDEPEPRPTSGWRQLVQAVLRLLRGTPHD